MNRFQRAFSELTGWGPKVSTPHVVSEENKAWISGMVDAGFFGSSEASEILEIIGDCKDFITMEPQAKRAATTVIFNALPFFEVAVNKTAEFMGCPYPVAESDSLQRVLDDFAGTVSVRLENNPNREAFQGAEMLMKTRHKASMKYGMSFCRDLYSDEGEEYQGILVHDSKRFTFASKDGIYQELQYRSPTGGLYWINENNRHWDSLGASFYPDSLWGLSAADGAQFFGKILIRIIVAHKNAWVWRGNPLVSDTIGVDKETAAMWGVPTKDSSSPWTTFRTKAASMFEKTQKALKEMDLGKRSVVQDTLPGQIQRETRVYGEGVTPMTGFVESADWLIRPLVALTGWHPELLGLFAGGGGIGSEKFNVLLRLTKPMIKTRRALEIPRLIARADTWMEANKVRAQFRRSGAFTWEFEEQDNLTAKERAEVDKMAVDTYAVAFENLINTLGSIEGIPGGISIEEIARQAAIENGLGWIFGEKG